MVIDATEYLNQIIYLENTLYNKREQLIEQKQRMIYVSPMGNDNVGGGSPSSSGSDKLPMQIARKEQLEQDIENLEKELVEVSSAVLSIIDKVTDPDISEILYLKYIRRNKMSTIAEKLDRSIKWVYFNHQQGINEVQSILNKIRRGTDKQYIIYDLINSEVLFTGTVKEISEYLQLDTSTVNACIYQEIPAGTYGIVEDLDDDPKMDTLRKIAWARIGGTHES